MSEYLPGDNLPLPSTPPQEPSGTFRETMHTRYPVPRGGAQATETGRHPPLGHMVHDVHPTRYATPSCAHRGPFEVQPEGDLRPASGILCAALGGALIWLVVLCLLSH
jgi:hypothetical protein